MSENDKSKLLAEALIHIRNSEISYGLAVGLINRVRKEKGLELFYGGSSRLETAPVLKTDEA